MIKSQKSIKFNAWTLNLLFFLALFPGQLLARYSFYPSSTTGEVVSKTYYKLSYSEEHEQAEWTAHHLNYDQVHGDTSRTDNFREDAQINYGSAQLIDYKGSGYDRGHLVPAGDMKKDAKSMSETFFMSNISPQNPSMNRGIWRRLEKEIRDWVTTKTKKFFVITGPVLTNGLSTIGRNHVSVPDYFYKIVLDYSSKSYKVIAFLVPNVGSSQQLEDYVVSVDYLERITGIDFFQDLPNYLERKIERDRSPWKWGLY